METWEALAIAVVAFVLALALTPLARRIAPALGGMDHPGELSIHERPVSRLGGLAIGGAFFMAAFVSMLSGSVEVGQRDVLGGIVLAAALVLAVGVWEDIRGLSPWVRLALLLVAAGVALGLGLRLEALPAAAAGFPVLFLYLAGGANSINMLDGMDGLAAGFVAIAAAFLGIIAWDQGNTMGMALALALIGASLGFLYYNFSPASIFMGDGGSLFLGFVLASLAVSVSREAHGPLALLAPLAVIAIPVLDAGLAIVRRTWKGENPFQGDRFHIYDLVNALGLDTAKVVLLMYGIAAIFGLAGLGMSLKPAPYTIGLGALAVALYLGISVALGARAGAFKRG